jgi:hypothetical protein
MIKYIIKAVLNNNQQEEDYFCSRTLEWSLNPIIQDKVFDEIIISYDGKVCKETIDKLSENSKTPIITIPTSRYFNRTVDDLLFGNDPENLGGVDLKGFVNNNDKIFIAHMDAFFDKSIYQSMISFDKPMVFGTHNYVIFQIERQYYKWISDAMILGSVGFLRDHNIRFSWNKFTDEKKEYFYNLANTKNIYISGAHLSQVQNLDGLQEGSLKLAILQYLQQIDPTELIDVGDSNAITKKSVHFKAFFNPDPKSGERFIINNSIIQAVIFGRIQEQKDIIQKHIAYRSIQNKLLNLYNSYFGQKILNDQEKENFNLLIKE